MNGGEQKDGGIIMRLRWSEIVGFAVFMIAIGPIIYWAGAFSTRLTTVERTQQKHVEAGIHAQADIRLAVVEQQQLNTTEKLQEILRQLSLLSSKIEQIRKDPTRRTAP